MRARNASYWAVRSAESSTGVASETLTPEEGCSDEAGRLGLSEVEAAVILGVAPTPARSCGDADARRAVSRHARRVRPGQPSARPDGVAGGSAGSPGVPCAGGVGPVVEEPVPAGRPEPAPPGPHRTRAAKSQSWRRCG